MSCSLLALPRLAVCGRCLTAVALLALTACWTLAPVDAAGATPDSTPAVENARSAERTTAPARDDGGSRASSRVERDDDSAMTLDDIMIEGEIDVPQVLFITSRDHLRRSDLLHHLYLADAATVASLLSIGSGVDVSAVQPPRSPYFAPSAPEPSPSPEPQQPEE